MVAVVPTEAQVSEHLLMDRLGVRSSELCPRAARGFVSAWTSLPWEGTIAVCAQLGVSAEAQWRGSARLDCACIGDREVCLVWSR